MNADRADAVLDVPVTRARWTAFASIGPTAGAVLLLAIVALVAMTQGAAAIPVRTTLGMLLDRLPLIAIDQDVPATWDRIVFDVRLPRIVAAGLVGAALAYSGTAYQGVFRNPLADPFLLGVASGAGFGAAIAIISPLPSSAYGFGWVPVFAFVGAIATVSLVYAAARSAPGSQGATLILAGVALSAVLSAGISFILLTGGERARPILSFIFGGFNTASWERVIAALPYIVVGAVVVASHSRVMNVLQLDGEQAAQLGVNVTRSTLIILAAASLMAAAAVSVAGIIGFVGLIVPHSARMLVGWDHRRLLPVAALGGAAFLIAADLASRTILAPEEIPVGVLTAMIGGPFFLYLLRTRRVDGGR
ncbi:MAG: iron ABC transporter permease [Chloroflexi bacterium]|nr:iron ABC transporter permease [Chloroflexota bacterium]MDA1147611.1 iron ABC transporter permease [Chloroflexota bacterium]